MTTVQLTIAGFSITAAKQKNSTYAVCVREYEDYLDLSSDFTRDCKRGKSPEVLQQAGIHTGLRVYNIRNGRSTMAFLDTRDFVSLLGVFATRGNQKALALVVALANETLERRVDSALNVNTPEEDYEARTKAFFREMARKSFIPEYTSHLTQLEVTPMYGAEVNKLKTALGLPLSSIDTYNATHMQAWSSGLTRYDCLRMEGYSHKRALNRIALVRAAREE